MLCAAPPAILVAVLIVAYTLVAVISPTTASPPPIDTDLETASPSNKDAVD